MEDIFWGNLYKNQEDLANEIPDNFKKVSEYFSVDEFIFPDIDESKEEIELLINSIASKLSLDLIPNSFPNTLK